MDSDGKVLGWGTSAAHAPTNLSNVVALAAGHTYRLALTAEGTVAAWGQNYAGQTNVPLGLSNVVAVAAGHTHGLALLRDGGVTHWGEKSSRA